MADITINLIFNNGDISKKFKKTFKELGNLSWGTEDEIVIKIFEKYSTDVSDFIVSVKNKAQWMKKKLIYYLDPEEINVYSSSDTESENTRGYMEYCDLDEDVMKHAGEYQKFLSELLLKMGAAKIDISIESYDEEELNEYN
ncbi:MAG TPA: hypothetical protein PK358_12785 [Spirochaetota bacterium]|nr:hypothetical protein [Spirochaetota bacterium]HPJ35705.1 hypothetical protein [Spirochaetota bacterium]